MNGDFKLDAAVVLGALACIAGALAALVFVQIPQANMTLFASITSALLGGVIGAYAGYRWGASKGSAQKDQVIADMVVKAGGE